MEFFCVRATATGNLLITLVFFEFQKKDERNNTVTQKEPRQDFVCNNKNNQRLQWSKWGLSSLRSLEKWKNSTNNLGRNGGFLKGCCGRNLRRNNGFKTLKSELTPCVLGLQWPCFWIKSQSTPSWWLVDSQVTPSLDICIRKQVE